MAACSMQKVAIDFVLPNRASRDIRAIVPRPGVLVGFPLFSQIAVPARSPKAGTISIQYV
jgi:hypothetical protein